MCLEQSKINQISKVLEEVKPSKSLHKNAEMYLKLSNLSKEIELKMDQIKPLLLDGRVEEYFTEEEMKVVFVEGREMSYLDTKIVIKEIGQSEFNKIATVSEKAIKDNCDNAEFIVSKAKVVLEERAKPSIKVGKMSKEDKQRIFG